MVCNLNSVDSKAVLWKPLWFVIKQTWRPRNTDKSHMIFINIQMLWHVTKHHSVQNKPQKLKPDLHPNSCVHRNTNSFTVWLSPSVPLLVSLCLNSQHLFHVFLDSLPIVALPFKYPSLSYAFCQVLINPYLSLSPCLLSFMRFGLLLP